MDNFAFILHPIDPRRDVARKFELLGTLLPIPVIDYLSRFFPPIYLSHITGIQSEATGKVIKGWLLACPLTAHRMLTLPPRVAYQKVIETGQLAERLGAQLVGLGAYTSVVGDAGVTISKGLSIPVTTGDSYTVALVLEALRKIAERMEIELATATAAVVGGSGTIGRACARLLGRDVACILLVGRRAAALEKVASEVRAEGGSVRVSTEIEAIRQADLVLSATSAPWPIIEPQHLKTGAVVCDVARPHDVSYQVIEQRPDVLVIDGGIARAPGQANFGFDFGLAPNLTFGCMAETMILALEGRYECYTLGREINVEQVEEIARLGARHGFGLSEFRSFEQRMTDEQIEQIKDEARSKRH